SAALAQIDDGRVDAAGLHPAKSIAGGMGSSQDPRRPHGESEVDDHDAAFGFLVVLVLVVVASRPLPSLVADGDLQLRPLVAPPLLFLAASDLFDDPGLEHRENL